MMRCHFFFPDEPIVYTHILSGSAALFCAPVLNMTGMPLLGQDLFPPSFPQWQQDAQLHKVHTQQLMAHSKSDWNIELCHCCTDAPYCCRGFWCCFCNACKFSEEFGQHRCLPMCDICACVFMACSCGICVPPATLALRVSIRDKYGIQGNLLNDMMVSGFCICCTWCQMMHELKYRQGLPPPVVHMQPERETQPNAPVKRATGFVVASY